MGEAVELQKQVNSDEKYSYVVAGAILKCSCSDTYSVLTAPLSHGVYIKGKAQLNIMDFKPDDNIRSFGKCKSLKNPSVAKATSIAYSLALGFIFPGFGILNAALNSTGIFIPGPVVEMPCVPVTTTQWINGKDDKLVEEFPALLNISKNMCAYAGEITIVDDGQE